MRKAMPFEYFEKDEDFFNCCKYWKDVLRLTDWVISFSLYHDELYNSEGVIVKGNTTYEPVLKAARVEISDYSKSNSLANRVLRPCVEETVVHELLHLRLSLLDAPSSYEGKCAELYEHTNVEILARSFIMAKYDLDWSYFANAEGAVEA